MPFQSVPDEILEWKDELILSMTQSNSSCIAIFKQDGSLIFANEAMHALFVGNPCDSLINPTFEKLISLGCPKEREPLFSGHITIGSHISVSSSIIAQVYRKSDSILVVGGVNAKDLLAQNEAMLLLNRQVNDLQRQLIKEKHGLEVTLEKLNKANDELKVLNATKDKFFSIIAHDLRNPFGAILALSSLIAHNEDKYSKEQIETFSSNLYLASTQANALLENLLEWSRIQTGRITPNPQSFYFNDSVDSVLGLCKYIADEKSILLTVGSVDNLEVFVDKEMVDTVLRNLVTNALKYTYPNGSVTISASRRNNYLVCSVTDTGVGIDQDNLKKLFRVEEMISAEGTSSEKGSGLGLILCKDFIEMNSGEIWAESIPDKGSTFHFSVPLQL